MPDPGDTLRREIVVSLAQNTITVLENGVVVRTITTFSTGRRGHLTDLVTNGKIGRRRRLHRSRKYNNAPMPYALFFEPGTGCAFHEGDPVVESHGCIHLAHDDAKWLFEWVAAHDVVLNVLGPDPKAVAPAGRAAGGHG